MTGAARLDALTSLPSRGAWIETTDCEIDMLVLQSLPSRGAWIETFRRDSGISSRSLRGERGLKHLTDIDEHGRRRVAPFAGSVD